LGDFDMDKHRVYCSGPLFCAEEIGGMNAIAQVIEGAGLRTFLPHRDGLEAYVMRFPNSSFPSTLPGLRHRVDYAIFSLDVYELIEGCGAVVCNLNGRVPDEGMIVEAALAYAAGKPLVLFKDDARAPFGGYDNSMLTSLVRGSIVGKLADVPSALTEALSREMTPAPLSDELRKAVSYGKRISSLLGSMPGHLLKKSWSPEVIDQVLAQSLVEV
jgi:nucleoside 2-deoxyribosyltransferase